MENKRRMSELTLEDIEELYKTQSGLVETNSPHGNEDFMVILKRGAEKLNKIKKEKSKAGKY